MRQLRIALAVLLSTMLASCATASIEDAVPRSAAEVPARVPDGFDAAEAAAFAPRGMEAGPVQASDEGSDLPNLNIRPQTAAPQFSDEERDERARALREAGLRAGEPVAGADLVLTAEELRRIAREREEEALRRIEGR